MLDADICRHIIINQQTGRLGTGRSKKPEKPPALSVLKVMLSMYRSGTPKMPASPSWESSVL